VWDEPKTRQRRGWRAVNELGMPRHYFVKRGELGTCQRENGKGGVCGRRWDHSIHLPPAPADAPSSRVMRDRLAS
jgi:hypothetical protein